MNIWRKTKHWWSITKKIFRGDPVRSWRRTEDGKYCCDGDCGRWSSHGVCTCGICHWFKIDPDNVRTKIHRDKISWHREYQTQHVMMDVQHEKECSHGLSWNDHCHQCEEECKQAMKYLTKNLEKQFPNENHSTTL